MALENTRLDANVERGGTILSRRAVLRTIGSTGIAFPLPLLQACVAAPSTPTAPPPTAVPRPTVVLPSPTPVPPTQAAAQPTTAPTVAPTTAPTVAPTPAP